MIHPDRTQPPKTQRIESFEPVKAEKFKLSNGIPAYAIESGTEDIVKIDLQFRAGNWFQPKPLVAVATSDMLTEGTKNLTSAEIANKLDFYGAFLRANANKDIATVTLLTLDKYLEPTLDILADIIRNPAFPEHEFNTYIQNKKHQFLLERSKVNSLSRVKFNEALFGPDHPYGKILELEDHDKIKLEDMEKFHKSQYTPENCEILITGKTNREVTSLVDKYLGINDWKKQETLKQPEYNPVSAREKEIFTPKDNAVQAAVRMGKRLFTKHHPDYLKMKIVTTILGGYFGSRLMKNVREEKGYTYGINAILISMVNEGYFVIVSEVGSNVCRKAIDAIKEEIKRLKNEKVGKTELDMVKNYMTGELLRSFDGPLPTSSSYLSILENKVSENYFKILFDEINNITAPEIMELSNKYLNEEEMFLSIAGQCEK
jgi:predicted Zn-dependent peptidase